MSDPVAMLFVVAMCVELCVVTHFLTRRTRIEITNEFIEADTESEDDPADFWKRSEN